jgi:hypothetical protein
VRRAGARDRLQTDAMADGAVDRPAVGHDEATADMAIAYAVEQGWLITAGSPPLSICLTDDDRSL